VLPSPLKVRGIERLQRVGGKWNVFFGRPMQLEASGSCRTDKDRSVPKWLDLMPKRLDWPEGRSRSDHTCYRSSRPHWAEEFPMNKQDNQLRLSGAFLYRIATCPKMKRSSHSLHSPISALLHPATRTHRGPRTGERRSLRWIVRNALAAVLLRSSRAKQVSNQSPRAALCCGREQAAAP